MYTWWRQNKLPVLIRITGAAPLDLGWLPPRRGVKLAPHWGGTKPATCKKSTNITHNCTRPLPQKGSSLIEDILSVCPFIRPSSLFCCCLSVLTKCHQVTTSAALCWPSTTMQQSIFLLQIFPSFPSPFFFSSTGGGDFVGFHMWKNLNLEI